MSNNPKYKDEKWLREKRGKDSLEFKEIAELCDGEWWNIRYWCYKYGIKKGEFSYKNYDWMCKQYQENELSDYQIANKLGMWEQTILKWRHKLGIPTRDRAEAIHIAQGNHVNITKRLLEIIDGSLLGDGSIVSYYDCSGNYGLGQKHRSYVKWRSNTLEELGIKRAGKISKSETTAKEVNNRLNGGHDGVDKVFTLFHYLSLNYHELRGQRLRWYPNDVKRVPKDILFTPTSLLIWFLEDGYYRDRPNAFSQQLHFSTDCFPKSDVDFLNTKLSELFDTDNFSTNQNKRGNWVLDCHDPTTIASFFDYLAPLPNCLKEDYNYKFPFSN